MADVQHLRAVFGDAEYVLEFGSVAAPVVRRIRPSGVCGVTLPLGAEARARVVNAQYAAALTHAVCSLHLFARCQLRPTARGPFGLDIASAADLADYIRSHFVGVIATKARNDAAAECWRAGGWPYHPFCDSPAGRRDAWDSMHRLLNAIAAYMFPFAPDVSAPADFAALATAVFTAWMIGQGQAVRLTGLAGHGNLVPSPPLYRPNGWGPA